MHCCAALLYATMHALRVHREASRGYASSGVMGVCLFSACVAAAAGAHTAARALGTVGCAVNAASFAASYFFLAREVLRRRRAATAAAASPAAAACSDVAPGAAGAAEARLVFATVGLLDGTSGGCARALFPPTRLSPSGTRLLSPAFLSPMPLPCHTPLARYAPLPRHRYIFERLMWDGLLAKMRRGGGGGGGSAEGLPWSVTPELWQLKPNHPLFGETTTAATTAAATRGSGGGGESNGGGGGGGGGSRTQASPRAARLSSRSNQLEISRSSSALLSAAAADERFAALSSSLVRTPWLVPSPHRRSRSPTH